MTTYDQDGFIQLIRKQSPDVKPKDAKKSTKNPFKKGSWKHSMLKILKKWKSSKYVSDFHFIQQENVFSLSE